MSVQHLPLDALLQLAGMLQELTGLHLPVIDHAVRTPYLGTLILVEEVLAQDQLHLLELFYPHLLRQIAEGTVIGGTGEGGIDLADITVAE